MTNVKTSPSLLEALRKAANGEPTAEEIFRQRVSFIMGTLKEFEHCLARSGDKNSC